MDAHVINTQAGQALAWVDQLQGLVSDGQEAMAGTPPTPQSLNAYIGELSKEAMPLCDLIRGALHAIRQNAGGE